MRGDMFDGPEPAVEDLALLEAIWRQTALEQEDLAMQKNRIREAQAAEEEDLIGWGKKKRIREAQAAEEEDLIGWGMNYYEY
jgi:hypothetical protein